MDPELYVFPKIQSPALKIAASSALFATLVTAARLLLPGSGRFAGLGENPAGWLVVLSGYALFILASYQAWLATREKNSVEDPDREVATRLLDSGFYARVRHPMYGLFILANAGLGLAAGSVYGLGFSLLSLAMFFFNGVFEERASLIPQFGDAYRDYMRRVPARCLTLPQAVLLAAALLLNAATVLLR